MNAEASSFDPDSFLDATTTEALVKRPPLPVGDYVATIQEVKSRAWTSQKPEAKIKAGIAVDIVLKIDLSAYPEAQKVTNGDSSQLRTSVMLDLNDGGSIDWSQGRNGALRRYREALDMNKAGEAFSIRQMQGRLIRVKIKHRTYEGELYDEVDSVAKA